MDKEILVEDNIFYKISSILIEIYPDIEMIFFLPNHIDEDLYDYYDYTLFVSAKSLDRKYDFDVYLEIFNLFEKRLTDKENEFISRITKFETTSPLRQQIKRFIGVEYPSMVSLKNTYLNNVKLPGGVLTLSI